MQAHAPKRLRRRRILGNPGNNEDVITFNDRGPEPKDDLKWVLVAAHTLKHFEEALVRIEGELPALSAKGAELAPRKHD
jgi:hypothetical protein